jgi:hypothetical protein
MLRKIQATDSNWDIFLDGNGKLWSEPNKLGMARGCAGSFYGDREHVRRLMNSYPSESWFKGWTDAGLEYMAGLASTLGGSLVYFHRA